MAKQICNVRTFAHSYGLGSKNPLAYSSVTSEKSKPTSKKSKSTSGKIL
jgi:hypothetical protein